MKDEFVAQVGELIAVEIEEVERVCYGGINEAPTLKVFLSDGSVYNVNIIKL